MNPRRLINFAVLATLLAAGPALAQDSAVATVVHFMNMNSSTWATVTPIIYDAGGVQVHAGEPIRLQGFGQGQLDLTAITALATGQFYSLVLDSDQPLSAMTTRTDTNLADSISMYGASPPSATLYFPIIKVSSAEDASAKMMVANPGSAPVQMTATFYNPDGSVFGSPITATIPANGHYAIDFSSSPNNRNNFDPYTGHAQVDLSGPCVGTVFQRTGNAFYTLNGHGQPGTNLVGPIVRDSPYPTTFRIQNAGSNQTIVRTVYYDNTGSNVPGPDMTVCPGCSVEFQPPAFPGGAGHGVVCTSDTPVVCSALLGGPQGPSAGYNLAPGSAGSGAFPYVGPPSWIAVQTPTGGWVLTDIYDGNGNRVIDNEFRLGPNGAFSFAIQNLSNNPSFTGTGMGTVREGTGNWVIFQEGPGDSLGASCGAQPVTWSQMSCVGFER